MMFFDSTSYTVDLVLDETESFDEDTRERLRDCIPVLSDGLHCWQQTGAYYPNNPRFVLMAAATTKRSTVFISMGWPKVPDIAFNELEVTAQIAKAIDTGENSDATDIVAAGLTMLLGVTGIAAQQNHAEQLIALGGRPLLVALIEDEAILVTTVALSLAVATVH